MFAAGGALEFWSRLRGRFAGNRSITKSRGSGVAVSPPRGGDFLSSK